MELLDNAIIVCFHTPSRQTVMCNGYVFLPQIGMSLIPAHRLFCILKVARYIYLTEFLRLVASVRKQIHVLK